MKRQLSAAEALLLLNPGKPMGSDCLKLLVREVTLLGWVRMESGVRPPLKGDLVGLLLGVVGMFLLIPPFTVAGINFLVGGYIAWAGRFLYGWFPGVLSPSSVWVRFFPASKPRLLMKVGLEGRNRLDDLFSAFDDEVSLPDFLVRVIWKCRNKFTNDTSIAEMKKGLLSGTEGFQKRYVSKRLERFGLLSDAGELTLRGEQEAMRIRVLIEEGIILPARLKDDPAVAAEMLGRIGTYVLLIPEMEGHYDTLSSVLAPNFWSDAFGNSLSAARED